MVNTQAVVLAAGRSSRFKRKRSKLTTDICGRPMIIFPLKVLNDLKIPTTVVLGYQAEDLKSKIEKAGLPQVSYALQEERLGTGHAVLCSCSTWNKDNILILNGDVPLLTAKLIEKLIKRHDQSGAILSFVTTHVLNPEGYGRVEENDNKVCIYEEKDCPEEFLSNNVVNAGIYIVRRTFLEDYISKIAKSAVSGEFYITDLVRYASENGENVQSVSASFDEVRGVNTLKELWAVEQIMRSKLIEKWMERGVRFELAQSIHIDIDVEIGPDSFIGTGAHILGNTKIGEGCFIAAFTIIEDSTIGDETNVHSHSVVQHSVIGNNVHLGPFARLRSNVVVEDNVCLGNFVEVKNSFVGKNSKAKHLTYVGDATIGQSVNIGAGTVFCNYDGKNKHKAIVEDGAFVGSNNTLISPVKIGKGAYVAAGSTITKDVPAQDLAIARARQENKAGYANKLGKKKFMGAVKTRGGEEIL